jgi:hypothetical protein
MPKNRVRYFLTPAGLARKSKLTVEYLQYSVNFYKDIKDLLLNNYMELKKDNVGSVLFYGAGEVAELAFLYLQLTDIQLVGIIDDKHNGRYFFGFQIAGLDCIQQMDWDVILLTRLEDTDQDIKSLLERGIDPERIVTI